MDQTQFEPQLRVATFCFVFYTETAVVIIGEVGFYRQRPTWQPTYSRGWDRTSDLGYKARFE